MSSTNSSTRRLLPIAVLLASLLTSSPGSRTAVARGRLENICTIYGQHEVHLTGLGLVVGLNGEGDGPRSAPTIRALAAALKLMNNPIAKFEDLRETKNVAIVLVSATVPRTGIRRGQRIDCRVDSFMGAKSLRGGRLLATPLETVDIADDRAVAIASGEVYAEDPTSPTSGRIYGGAHLERNFSTPFVRNGVVTLLLGESHASFHAASEVAQVVNAEFRFEARSENGQADQRFGPRRVEPVAVATAPGVVEVRILEQYLDDPVEFVAQVLDVNIENPHTQARVLVNARTQTVVVTGEVQIDPVVITHENLTINVAGAPPLDEPAQTGFVAVTNEQSGGTPQRLKDLVGALNALKVPTADVIEIIRVLHDSGKLHAEFIEN